MTTLCVAGILLRSCYKKGWVIRTREHEPINTRVTNYESINGNIKDGESSIESVMLSTSNTSLLSDSEDHQTVRQSLL